ncbi:hypothetical protein LTS01_025163 [Friedmanniomyces endolithicus]|nr:hypothetical protein LTS01_025163 [Friedmanniomyces endolithicus]
MPRSHVYDSHCLGVYYDANVLSMRITRQAASWLALTPQKVVQKTLDLPQELIDALPKTKRYIFPGNTNLTTANFTVAESQNAKLTATSETLLRHILRSQNSSKGIRPEPRMYRNIRSSFLTVGAGAGTAIERKLTR